MANTIGTAYIQILPSTKGISSGITKELGGLNTNMFGNANKSTDAWRTKMSAAGKTMMKVGAGMTAVGGAAALLGKKYIDLASNAQQSQTKLTEVMKAMMGANKGQVQEVNNLIAAQAKSGVIGQTAQRTGAQQLATYLHSTGALKKLIPAMNDLAVQQYGTNVSGEQLVGISNMMGKVFTGQVGALRRAGISFDAHSEKIMKNGTEAEKAAELYKVIGQNVGHMNTVMAKTPAGRLAQARNQLQGMRAQIGAQLLPIVSQLATFVSQRILPAIQNLINFIEAHPTITKIAVAMTLFLTIGGAVLTTVGGMAIAFSALNISMSPALGIIAGIMAGIALVVVVVTHWGAITEWFKKTWTSAMTAVGRKITAVKAVVATVVNAVKQIFEGLKGKVTAVMSAIKSVVTTAVSVIKRVFGGLSSIAGVVARIFNGVKNAILHPITTAKAMLHRVITTIKNMLTGSWSFPHIKIPHISVSGGKVPWGIGGKGTKPSISISYYKEGGIFTRPTLLGENSVVGEAGSEAVLPLSSFYRNLDRITARNMSGETNVTINVYGAQGQDVSDLADIVADKIVSLGRRKAAMIG